MMTVQVAGQVRKESMEDGIGIRAVAFLQGCSMHCEGCQNADTQDFAGGKLMTTVDLANEIVSAITPLHKGITFSGGDPLDQAHIIPYLYEKIRTRVPVSIDFWMYTGRCWEEIIKNPVYLRAVQSVDVLVDGPYIQSLRSLGAVPFRGSSNQRIILVKESLESEKIIEMTF